MSFDHPLVAPRPRHKYLLLVQQDGMPAESIISVGNDLEALKGAISAVRSPREPSRLAFRGLKRDATIAQIFDTEALATVATFDARLDTWKPAANDVPRAPIAA